MLLALIVVPLLFLPLTWLLPSYRLRSWLLPLAGAVHLLLVIMALGQVGVITSYSIHYTKLYESR